MLLNDRIIDEEEVLELRREGGWRLEEEEEGRMSG